MPIFNTEYKSHTITIEMERDLTQTNSWWGTSWNVTYSSWSGFVQGSWNRWSATYQTQIWIDWNKVKKLEVRFTSNNTSGSWKGDLSCWFINYIPSWTWYPTVDYVRVTRWCTTTSGYNKTMSWWFASYSFSVTWSPVSWTYTTYASFDLENETYYMEVWNQYNTSWNFVTWIRDAIANNNPQYFFFFQDWTNISNISYVKFLITY